MTTRKRLRNDHGAIPTSKRTCSDDLAPREPAPLTSELPPPPRREKQLTLEEARRGTTEPVRVYADGVFDLFHNGHARALMQAKNAFPNTYLIVGVPRDELTHQLKGRTVMTDRERYESLKHCRYVDEVLQDCPWTITPEFLEEHQIDFVAHDDQPYGCGDVDDIYREVKEIGKFVPTQRTEGISTSDLIGRIVKDYDMYVRRNLARGYTAREMNVGFMKEKEIRIKDKMSGLKHSWDEKSKDLIGGFMGLFGRDGRISEFFHGQKEKIKRVFTPTDTPNQSFEQGPSSSSASASPSPSPSPRSHPNYSED